MVTVIQLLDWAPAVCLGSTVGWSMKLTHPVLKLYSIRFKRKDISHYNPLWPFQ